MFYKDEKSVDKYIKIAEGSDGRDLVEILRKYLKNKSTLLEIGIGPGKDLDILDKFYKVTGSDFSDIFLKRYRKKHHNNIELYNLDAKTLDIDKKFDCIYSNKVLYHLPKNDFIKSMKRQYEILNEKGIVMHTLWLGEGIEEYDGVKFYYYTFDEINMLIKEKLSNIFEIIELKKYKEMEKDDSVYMILKKK